MKKILFIIILCLNVQSISAQSSFSDIKSSHKWAWLGLDFSNTKLIGHEGFSNPEKIVNEYLPKINMLVFSEADKYDVMAAFRMDNYDANYLYFDILNSSLSTDELFVGSDYSLEESDILSIVAKYNFDKVKQDIALVFIVESLDKTNERATMWVTIINTKTNNLILAERMNGEPGGIGFRNYWARPVLNVIQEIKEKRYKKWQNMY